tara:strand:+ start:2883 stop:3782 length:900 start_codon:yes stop_codon:yes gene_type:complete
MSKLYGFLFDVLALTAMAIFVTLESRLAPSIFSDEIMQFGYIGLCILVALAIFGVIKTQNWHGITNKATGFLLLAPLLLHAAGAAMTANIGAMHDKKKQIDNNVKIIADLKRQQDALYIDKSIFQSAGMVTKAKETTSKIDSLTLQINNFRLTQKASIDDKYSGHGALVINILGGSFGLIALFLEFVFALCAARCYAEATTERVRYAGTQDDTQQAEYEQGTQREPTRAEIRADEQVIKKAVMEEEKETRNLNISIAALAGHIIQEGIKSRDEARSNYKGKYTYKQVDQAWQKAQTQRV